MKIIETSPREIGFVLWGHCQNLLDDPRTNLIICISDSQENVQRLIINVIPSLVF